MIGATRDADTSIIESVRVDPRVLADMVQDSASDPVTLRELDASVRAALAGDDVPLLRLAGQSGVWNHSPSEAGYFSRGAYLAVSCLDYPRLKSFAGAPEAFAPFTAAEWLTISGFSQPYDICLDWPALEAPAGGAVREGRRAGPDRRRRPGLADAAVGRPGFGPKLGDDVSIVTLKNTVHVTSEGDTYLVEGMRCARRVIRSFLRGALNSSCAGSIPALHVPDYPLTLGAAVPASLVSGPDPGETARRAATVAAQAFADATMRWIYTGGARFGAGLRGGRFVARGEKLTLERVRFVSDQVVSGTGTFKAATGAVDATLTVAGVTVHVTWTQATPQATARIGDSVLTLPAP